MERVKNTRNMLLANIFKLNFFKKLNQIESKHPCVLWIRDPSYKKQIYVSPRYEKIWGRSCHSLYTHPEKWNDTLVSSDKMGRIEKLIQRNTQANPNHTEFYCISTPRGQHQWVQDRSFNINYPNGTQILVAGVAYPISIEEMIGEAQKNVSDTIDIIVIQFSKLLLKNINLQEKFEPKKTYDELSHLSNRQMQILYYILLGKSSKEIGKVLNLSFRTVENYTQNIKKKLHCDSKSEIITKAIENNFLQINMPLIHSRKKKSNKVESYE